MAAVSVSHAVVAGERRHRFFHDVLTLVTGTVASQAMLMVVLPFLTRAYGAEAFGYFGVYSAAVGILAIFINIRLDLAVIKADSHERAARLTAMSLSVACVVGGVLTGLLVLGEYLGSFFFDMALPFWVPVIPLSAAATAVFNTLGGWHSRQGRFRFVALQRFAQTLMLVVLQCVFVYLYPFHDGLILGSLIASLAIASYWVHTTSQHDPQCVARVPLSEMKEALYSMKGFSMQVMSIDVLSQMLYQLPMAYLGYLFSPVAMGYYTLTQRVLAVPANLIGGAVAEVFRQRATVEFNASGQCRHIFIQTGRWLASISVLGVLVSYWLLPTLFEWVFGAQWRDAGQFAQSLLPAFLLKFVTHPLSYVIMLADKLRFELILHVVMLVVLLLGMGLCGAAGLSATQMLGFYSLLYVAFYAAYLLYAYHLSRGNLVGKS